MNGAFELLVIMLAVCSPIIVIVFIKQYFQTRREMNREMAELRTDLDAIHTTELKQQVDSLTERVKVLETIVTDKGYEVSEKISQLK